tara:strand:+ start:264 stop:539 length:276 start_codon:yes stop_codon:yes gene_type:complete
MIDEKAKDKATQAIREARRIDNHFTYAEGLHKRTGGKGRAILTLRIVDTPEFWAGINLLLQGEYKQLPNPDKAPWLESATYQAQYITLQRR